MGQFDKPNSSDQNDDLINKEVRITSETEEDRVKLKERLAEINKFFAEKNKKYNGQPYIANDESSRLSDEKAEIEAKLNS